MFTSIWHKKTKAQLVWETKERKFLKNNMEKLIQDKTQVPRGKWLKALDQALDVIAASEVSTFVTERLGEL